MASERRVLRDMSFGGFSIDRDESDGKVRLVLSGELDIAEVDRLKDEVDRRTDGETVQLDTTGLAFIDSSGLAAIVAVRNRLGAERFQLIPGEAVQRLLKLSGTEDYLLD